MAELNILSDEQLSNIQGDLLETFENMSALNNRPEYAQALAHTAQALITLDQHIIKNKLTIK
jgi:hypothetical protein